jgi:hypothetical protein
MPFLFIHEQLVLLHANIAVLPICIQMLYLCFPSSSATSEPSGLDALTPPRNINEIILLIDRILIHILSNLSACYS